MSFVFHVTLLVRLMRSDSSVTSFFVRMLLVTIMVDKAITHTFVIHSLNLPIKIARNHDDEEVRHIYIVIIRILLASSVTRLLKHCSCMHECTGNSY